jgi:hypothetical protein
MSACLPGVDHDQVRPDGEDALEADAELADLGEVVLLARREQGQQVIVDDPLVHPLAVVDHGDRHPSLVVGEGDLDPRGRGVERVLHQLAQHDQRVGELGDHRRQRLVGAGPAGAHDLLALALVVHFSGSPPPMPTPSAATRAASCSRISVTRRWKRSVTARSSASFSNAM